MSNETSNLIPSYCLFRQPHLFCAVENSLRRTTSNVLLRRFATRVHAHTYSLFVSRLPINYSRIHKLPLLPAFYNKVIVSFSVHILASLLCSSSVIVFFSPFFPDVSGCLLAACISLIYYWPRCCCCLFCSSAGKKMYAINVESPLSTLYDGLRVLLLLQDWWRNQGCRFQQPNTVKSETLPFCRILLILRICL